MPSRYARNTIPLVRDRRPYRVRHMRPRFVMLDDPDTYLGRVAVDREVASVNFARFIQAALDAARARGIGSKAVADATGVGLSTIHRWRRADWGSEWPKLQQVIDFCTGLGIPEEDAFAALGLRGERRAPEPAPIDPEVMKFLRALADPNTPKAQKDAIRMLMRSFNVTPTQPKPSTRPLRRRKGA